MSFKKKQGRESGGFEKALENVQKVGNKGKKGERGEKGDRLPKKRLKLKGKGRVPEEF